MSTHETIADALPTMTERLTEIVRAALLEKQTVPVADQIENVVAGVLAGLCPPNHLLLVAEVVREHDGGMDTPNGYEPEYDYAAIRDFVILHDTLDAAPAALLTFAAELSEVTPDGTGTLDQQIGLRFASQQEEMLQQSRETSRSGPFSTSAFENALKAATTTSLTPDRSTT